MTSADEHGDQTIRTLYKCRDCGELVRPTPVGAWKTGDRTS